MKSLISLVALAVAVPSFASAVSTPKAQIRDIKKLTIKGSDKLSGRCSQWVSDGNGDEWPSLFDTHGHYENTNWVTYNESYRLFFDSHQECVAAMNLVTRYVDRGYAKAVIITFDAFNDNRVIEAFAIDYHGNKM